MTPTGHSPLGFSGAERYMNCPGSVALIASLGPGEGEGDPEYRVAGTAAHAAWAWCLKDGKDAWEATEQEWEGYTLTAEDLAAGQVYLDDARARIKAVPVEHKASAIVLIEKQFHAPDIHELAWGTIDLGLVAGFYCEITDYKHGEGIFVDAVENPQLMGYACLVLAKFPFIKHFKLRIVQPRCQYSGPREWEISADYLEHWRRDRAEAGDGHGSEPRAIDFRAAEARPVVPLLQGQAGHRLSCPGAERADRGAVARDPRPAL